MLEDASGDAQQVVAGRLRVNHVAAVLIAIGAVVRLYYADASYLNPDEAMHYSAAARSTWAGVYAASTHQAHPPLLLLVTHAWLPLVHSELLLRLPSIAAGVLSLWFAYLWLKTASTPIAALAGLTFLCVSPAMISAATELRHTAWLLLFVFAALHWCERFIARQRYGDVVCMSVALSAALLSHYSAMLVAAACAGYVAVRLLLVRARLQAWLSWASLQICVALVGYWSLFVHGKLWAPKLFAGTAATTTTTAARVARTGAARFSYVAPTLHQPEKESAATFALRGWLAVWEYLCGNLVLAGVVLAALALAMLLAWWASGRKSLQQPFLLVLVLPFAIGAGAGLLRLYPFGGSRHVAFLLPFAAGAIGTAVAQLVGKQRIRAVAVCAVAVLAWLGTTVPANDPSRMGRANLQAALEFLHTRPPETLLVVDFQTRHILEFYWRRRARYQGHATAQLDHFAIGEQKILSTHWGVWALSNGNCAPLLKQAASTTRRQPGHPVWAFSTAWPNHQPATHLPSNLVGTTREFGQAWVLQAQIWSPQAPASNQTSPAH